MALPRNNFAKLLTFVKKPSKLCLILLVVSVFVLVNNRWLFGTGNDRHTSDAVDDVTSGLWKTLQTSLGFSALHMVRHLCFRHMLKTVLYVRGVAPCNRLLLAFLSVAGATVFLLAPGYSVMMYTAGLFARRISSGDSLVLFDDLEDRYLFSPSFVSSGNSERDFVLPTFHSRYRRSWDKPAVFYRSGYSQRTALLLTHGIENEIIGNRHTAKLLTHGIGNEIVPYGNHYDRYPIEDVELLCELYVQVPEDVDNVFVETYWTFNKTLVDVDGERVSVRSHRGFVHRASNAEESVGTRCYFVKEPLSIKRLREADFGVYTCRAFVSFIGPASHRARALSEERRRLLSKAVSTLEVRMRSPEREERSVHPADSVSISVIYRMLHDSPDDVLIEHKVNGIPVYQLPDVEKCSSELQWPFLDFSQQQNNQYLKTSDPEGHAVLIETHKFCVEQYNYGLHTFTIRRQFYNPRTAQTDFVEGEYYKSVLVVPEMSEIFSDVKDNAYFSFTHMNDCWENQMIKSTQDCNEKMRRVKLASRLHYTLDCWTTMTIYIVIHVYWLWWSYGIVRYVLKLTLPELFCQTVVTTARHVPPPPEGVIVDGGIRTQTHLGDFTEGSPTSSDDCDKTRLDSTESCSEAGYDVFLAYASEDSAVCERVMMTLSGHDVRVFDSQYDVRPGQAPLTAWDHAMEHSHGFVVIVSRHYLAQSDLMLQFQVIHNLLLEHRVTEDRLLLLIAGKCCVPPTLGPLPVIDLNLPHWQRQLEWWALTLKGEFSNRTVLRQMGRDLHRDSRDFLELSRRDDDVKQLLPGLPGLVRKLEAVCGTVTRTHSIDGGANKRQDDLCTQQTIAPPRVHDPSTEPSDSSSESDFEEVNVSELDDMDSEVNHLGSPAYRATKAQRGPPAPTHDVFLTYCEESSSDCDIARQLKEMLEGWRVTPKEEGEEEREGEGKRERKGQREFQGLRVYDAVQDLAPGQAEVHVVSAATDSAAYIVLLSPAYCSDPLTRRLHFPQVLHAVFTDRVPLKHVLIVHTSGTFDLLGEDIDRGEDDGCAESVALPEWFEAFTNIHWSPSSGLYEEGRLKAWVRRVMSYRRNYVNM